MEFAPTASSFIQGSASPTEDEFYEQMKVDIPAWLGISKQHTSSTTKHRESRAVAFWKTLIANRGKYSHRTSKQCEGARFGPWRNSSKLCRLYLSELSVATSKGLEPVRLKQTVFKATSYRRFFVIGNGSMGLVPMATKVGDIVVLFLGATVLFIIRPGAERIHQQVGECNCYSIMYGEAMENKTQWDRCVQEMTLR
jgi:hypothetical protein